MKRRGREKGKGRRGGKKREKREEGMAGRNMERRDGEWRKGEGEKAM